MMDYGLVKSAWATVIAHGGVVLLSHFADVDTTALQEALAPIKIIEDHIQGFREQALSRHNRACDSAGQA